MRLEVKTMRINKRKLAVAMANSEFNFIDLSIASGISRASLSYINSGKTCKPATAGKIAKALNVPVEKIFEQERA